MINFKTDFENMPRFGRNAGRTAIASGWCKINGNNEWLVVYASTDAKLGARKAKWSILATYTNDDGEKYQTEATVRDCYRYEAAQIAVDALTA